MMTTTRHKRITIHEMPSRLEQRRIERNHTWSRGFAVGFITACIIVAVFLYGQNEAYGAEKKWPPNASTWLRIFVCEQPKPGTDLSTIKTDADRFNAIAWHQTYNHSFAGGAGMTTQNWRDFRPYSARHINSMANASPAQQLWAAERLWRWAERTYPTNGHSAWLCSYTIGWTSADPKDALR